MGRFRLLTRGVAIDTTMKKTTRKRPPKASGEKGRGKQVWVSDKNRLILKYLGFVWGKTKQDAVLTEVLKRYPDLLSEDERAALKVLSQGKL